MSSFTPFRSLLRAANASPSSMLTRSAQRSSPFSTTASNQFSRLTIIGRLGADSELHTTASGREIVKYHVATNYGRGDNRQTSWFHVTHFLPQEANARKDFMLGLQKGTMVCVEADAVMKPLEDAEGRRRDVLNLSQRSLEVLKRPFSGESGQGE